MKRTIEYCDDLVNDKSRTYYEIVKQAQIDAINAFYDESLKDFSIEDPFGSLGTIAEQLKKELE